MRIILRYCLPYGNFSTQGTEVEEDATVADLQAKIKEKMGIDPKHQILKLKKKNIVKIDTISTTKLADLGVVEKSVVYIEKGEDPKEQENKQQGFASEEEFKKQAQMRVQSKFYNRLGLGMISEEGEDGEEKEGKSLVRKNTLEAYSWKKPGLLDDNIDEAAGSPNFRDGSPVHSNMSSDEEKRSVPPPMRGSIKSEQETLVESLISEVKNGNLAKIQSIIESTKKDKDEIKELLVSSGSGGWNPLHYAIYYGKGNILKDFIDRGIDLNKPTSEGWTPLILATHLKSVEIVKMLIKAPGIQINQATNQGTALHVAVKNSNMDITKILLQSGSDLTTKDTDGQTVYDLPIDEEIQSVIEAHISQPAIGSFEEKESKEKAPLSPGLMFRPPKPPIVKGYIYKCGGLFFNLRRRYLVINPDEGTLIRYKEEKDYPLKPMEIIPLKDIMDLKRIKKEWFLQDNYSYFEFFYDSRYIFGCESQENAENWVRYIYQGIVFCNYMEEMMELKMNNQIGDDEEEKQITDLINSKTKDIVELKDKSATSPTKKKCCDETPKNTKGNATKTSPRNENTSPKNDSKIPVPATKVQSPPKPIESPTRPNTNANNTPTPNKNGKEEIKLNLKDFDVLKVLGSGAFGKVYKVRRKDTGRIYAMKSLKKRNLLLKNQLKYALTECNVLRNATSHFILRLHASFQTPQHLYMVLDYCPGSDLAFHIAQRVTLEEHECRFYIAELILAIEHLHEMHVVYRDLKPENILIAADGHIRLADFGLSKEGVDGNNFAKSFCGSPAYLSPEMLKNKGVGKAADIYGIGAVMYEMLTGEPPYYSEDIQKIYENIRGGKLKFPGYMSEEAKNLITKLLSRDPKQRPGVENKEDLRNDPFFHGLNWDQVARKHIPPPIMEFDDVDAEDEEERGISLNDADYTASNAKVNRVLNFTFVREDEDEDIVKIQPNYFQ